MSPPLEEGKQYQRPQEQPTVTTNRHSQPPPYLIDPTVMTTQQQEHHRPRRPSDKHKSCLVCDNQDPPLQKTLGPYLLQHHDRVYWITLCSCANHRKVHVSCLSTLLTQNRIAQQDILTCHFCHYNYRTGWRIGLVKVMESCVHLLSLASVIGLVIGLHFLGRSLDILALGNDLGAKLDGDEKWQDHEMQAIADWLYLVHLVTALAGEALLGLVYVLGVCWIIGSTRTLNMIHAILYIDLKPLIVTSFCRTHLDRRPSISSSTTVSSCFYYGFLWFVLACFGLILGTYLLFYSWIWAVGFHFMCRKILVVRN